MLFLYQNYVFRKKHGSCAYFYGANIFEGNFLLHKTLHSFIIKTIHILYSSGKKAYFRCFLCWSILDVKNLLANSIEHFW